MKIEISENTDTRVTVKVSIPRRKYATDPNVHIDSSNIREFLSENNVDFENCIKETVVNNYANSPTLTGEWVFTKRSKVVKTQPEETIEGENEQPTTKRRRRRRPTTTTTED